MCYVDNWFGANHRCDTHNTDNHCQYEVWAPWYHNHVEDMAFNLFAMDVEERRSKIEQVIQLLTMATDPNHPGTQENVFLVVGLPSTSLTAEEIEYIENEVTRRYAQL